MPSSQDFNPICYLARYPDLKTGWMYKSASGVWKYGKPTNRELKQLSQNLNWHWTNFGMSEGRVCGCDLPGTVYSANFNASAYLSRYPDIRTGIDPVSGKATGYNTNPEGHYQTIGIFEGRHPGFEIVTSNSPLGMVSPGTTTPIEDNPLNNLTPGDGTVLNPVDPLGTGNTDTTITDSSTVDTTTGTDTLSNFVAGNPWVVAAGVVLILLLFNNKKHHKRA